MVVDKKEIKEDPDKVLKNNTKMREVIKDPELAICLLEEKGEYERHVEVDGELVMLARPYVTVEMGKRLKILNKMDKKEVIVND